MLLCLFVEGLDVLFVFGVNEVCIFDEGGVLFVVFVEYDDWLFDVFV